MVAGEYPALRRADGAPRNALPDGVRGDARDGGSGCVVRAVQGRGLQGAGVCQRRFVRAHEGIFAPFEFDVTPTSRQERTSSW